MLKLYDRTFGLELEFGNVEKKEVDLPPGYSWSPDERSIVNTNGKKSTPAGPYGGELNTRPLLPNLEDVREVRGIIKSCYDNGGENVWNTSFDGHIYVGDLGLDELKKIFSLSYYIYPLLYDFFKVADWYRVDHLVPVPSYDIYMRAMKSANFEALKNVFANSSNKGFFRYSINIMAYFKTETIEFRLFNATRNFRQTLETIKFMYHFIDYALNHDEEDFKKINSREKFIEAFQVKDMMPETVQPLIFAENPDEATRNIQRAFSPSKKMLSCVMSHPSESVLLVNPFRYISALSLYESKRLTIFNNDEYNHVMKLICCDDLEVEYKEHLAVLNEYKDGTAITELTLFMIFSKIHKYNLNVDFEACEFAAYVSKLQESIDKIKESCQKMYNMFSECDYYLSDINKALKHKGLVVYQQYHNSKNNSVISHLGKYSNYNFDFARIPTDYKNVLIDIPEELELMVFSKNPFLDLVKISKDLDCYLYSNKKQYMGVRSKVKKAVHLNYDTPPDDYRITDKTKIEIFELKPSYFAHIQQKFVKKVSNFKNCLVSFVVMCDGYVVGGFGFDSFSSVQDGYSMMLLSDFSTNNSVPRLAKLILYVIRSKDVKRVLERKFNQRMYNCYTKVYTTMKASMKYRGAFKKKKTDSKNSLTYEFDFGSIESIEAAKIEYIKSVERSGK